MSLPELEITDDPGLVWHVGFAPNPWGFAPWEYATDSGLFDGRWDDQLGQFRTLYTADSLLGCFLELLARFRPAAAVTAGLAEIDNDDGSVDEYDDAPDGTIGHSWLDSRQFGSAMQTGRYCFVTHSRSVAALQQHYPFDQHGLTPALVDTALLKDARDRVLTRSIARWLYDLRDDGRNELLAGVEFRSRHGDDIRIWATFERAEDENQPHSQHLSPVGAPVTVSDDTSGLLEAFERHGLRWRD